MTATIRLTAAQAMVRYIAAQKNQDGDPFLAGCWAIFGHGNVAGLGEALHAVKDSFPTWRGHNEQTMAHAAIAYAKQSGRKRAMAVTSSIGPGAANMVTAAALAHVNRLPVLLIPGDVFATRGPDPVLQQIEDLQDGTATVNDAFRPLTRYFDRITRPEQLLTALPRAFRVLTDPADCGPVCLSFCQDVQAEAFEYPESFFVPRVWRPRRIRPDEAELAEVAEIIRAARRPVIVAGGGVHYAGATGALHAFAEAHNIPVTETQAGKSALPWDHALNLGPVGVTGGAAANTVCAEADVVQKDLAALVTIEGPTMVGILDRLVKSGFVERRQSPQDRRANTVHLTDDGQQKLQEIEGDLRALREEMLAGLSSADLETGTRLLKHIAERAQKRPAPHQNCGAAARRVSRVLSCSAACSSVSACGRRIGCTTRYSTSMRPMRGSAPTWCLSAAGSPAG